MISPNDPTYFHEKIHQLPYEQAQKIKYKQQQMQNSISVPLPVNETFTSSFLPSNSQRDDTNQCYYDTSLPKMIYVDDPTYDHGGYENHLRQEQTRRRSVRRKVQRKKVHAKAKKKAALQDQVGAVGQKNHPYVPPQLHESEKVFYEPNEKQQEDKFEPVFCCCGYLSLSITQIFLSVFGATIWLISAVMESDAGSGRIFSSCFFIVFLVHAGAHLWLVMTRSKSSSLFTMIMNYVLLIPILYGILAIPAEAARLMSGNESNIIIESFYATLFGLEIFQKYQIVAVVLSISVTAQFTLLLSTICFYHSLYALTLEETNKEAVKE